MSAGIHENSEIKPKTYCYSLQLSGNMPAAFASLICTFPQCGTNKGNLDRHQNISLMVVA